MREKISIEKFRELISLSKIIRRPRSEEELITTINKTLIKHNVEPLLDKDEFKNSNTNLNYNDYDDYFATNAIEALKMQQRDLLSYDLSNIPFEEWIGFSFVEDGNTLDLSKTKGNYDFNFIKFIYTSSKNNSFTLIGKGCDIKNLKRINFEPVTNYYRENVKIYKENFDQETIDSNKDAFIEEYPDDLKIFIQTNRYSIESFLALSDESLDIIKNDPFFDELLINHPGVGIDTILHNHYLQSKESELLLLDLAKNNKEVLREIYYSSDFNKDKIKEYIVSSNFNSEKYLEMLHKEIYDVIIKKMYSDYIIYYSSISLSRRVEFDKRIDELIKHIYPEIIDIIKDNNDLVKKINNKDLSLDDFLKYPDLLSNPIFLYFSKDMNLKKFITNENFTPDEINNSTDVYQLKKEKALKQYETFIYNCKNFEAIKEHIIKANELTNIFINHPMDEYQTSKERILFDSKDEFYKISTETINKFINYYNSIKNSDYQLVIIQLLQDKLYDSASIDDSSFNVIIDFLKKSINNNGIDEFSIVYLQNVLRREDFSKRIKYNSEKAINLLKKYNIDNSNHVLYTSFINIIINNSDIEINQNVISELDYIKNIIDINKKRNNIYGDKIIDAFFTKYSNRLKLDSDDIKKVKDLEKILNYIEIKAKECSESQINSFVNYIVRSIENNNINSDNLDTQFKLGNRIVYSNSSELRRISFEVINQLSKLPIEEAINKLDSIEDIFLKNNLPYVAKLYRVFEALHENMILDDCKSNNLNSRKNNTSKEIIIFSDLLKSAMGSNNKSIIEYINNIEIGNSILKSMIEGKIDINDLNKKELADKKEIFEIYLKHLNALYNNTKEGIENPRIIKNNIIKDSYELLSLFLKEERENFDVSKLPDRIIRMFAHFAGFDTITDFKNNMEQTIKEKEKINIEVGKKGIVSIKKGDLLKGLVNINYVESTLQNGVLCKEFLGSSASSDATPMDTDCSLIVDDVNSIKDVFKHMYLATSYGPIWIVVKNDERINNTDLNPKYEPDKIELFMTGSHDHYGIRTGFPSSYIDYFIMDTLDPRLCLEIAKNGFYIPVANKEGVVTFTPEMYNEMRSKLSGLPNYGIPNYELSENLTSNEIELTKEKIKNSMDDTNNNCLNIRENISYALMNSGITRVINGFNSDLTPGTAEIYCTGSTARNTNVPNDSDYDYLVKIDREIYFDDVKYNEFKEQLKKQLNFKDGFGGKICGTLIKDNKEYEIEISICPRTDKIELSTDSSLDVKLNSIKEQFPESYLDVLANIVYAKELFKSVNAYKSLKSDATQGGLGGIGIENWILQHGGSLIDAARDFVDVAEKSGSFENFKNNYQVFDLGENHYIEKKKDKNKMIYPHDNFVGDEDKMGEKGYNRILTVLKEYIKKYDEEQSFKNGNKQL